ncbi:MAG: hypothetical protein ACR2PW_01780 [Gammaproteobacteria bacterium]
MKQSQQAKTKYPDDLLKWAGHRSGGVKKPFHRGSGRPAGQRFKTALSARLMDWATKYVNGEGVPTSILLVGGPGNGKTDTVEGLIEDLDGLLDLGGRLFEACGDQYSGTFKDEVPPRKVSVDLTELTSNLPENCRRQITIIQDATEADAIAEPGKSAEELLISELDAIARGDDDQIYICCVNRGILAQAYTKAQLDSQLKVVDILTEITKAVTSDPGAGSCWPLLKYPSVVAWPMDMDTLVADDVGDGKKAVLHQIIEQVTHHDSWQTCDAGGLCPFCTNKEVLLETQNVDNLSKLLRAFELGTGKRWSFRDLYSLISYILVGSEEELVVAGKQLSPCEWAAKQLELMQSARRTDEADRARAVYRLASSLYWHRLFPLWPRLATKNYTESRKKLTGGIGNPALAIDDLFRFLQWRGRTSKAESVLRTVASKFCPLLDPAQCDPNDIIRPGTKNLTVRELDERFSLSVGQGQDLIKGSILPIEREILDFLRKADERLGSDFVSNQNQTHAERLQATIRLFACRLVKRSLGARNGVYAKMQSLTSYKEALDNPKILKNVRTRLRSLINDEKRNIFTAPMMTTFAQPAPSARRNLVLECPKVRVSGRAIKESERPKAQTAYLNVNETPVPLTFELYDALQNLDAGMHPGSLDDEVFAMIDRIRSKVTGRVVRDPEVWEAGAVLMLEATGEVIHYSDAEFSITNRGGEA